LAAQAQFGYPVFKEPGTFGTEYHPGKLRLQFRVGDAELFFISRPVIFATENTDEIRKYPDILFLFRR